MLDKFLAKGAALVGVLHRFLVADAGEANGLDDDTDALVVEVGHDDCSKVKRITVSSRLFRI